MPGALLVDRQMSARSKLVWMILQLEADRVNTERGKVKSPGPVSSRSSLVLPTVSRLARVSGFSRPTVRKALAELHRLGWLTERSGRRIAIWPPDVRPHSVNLPEHLILAERLTAVDKLLYGILKAKARGLKSEATQLCFESLSRTTGLSVKLVRESVRALEASGWLELRREKRNHPIYYAIQDPMDAYGAARVEAVKRRLKRAEFLGEALMREYLSLLVESDVFQDNASPGFLVNPLTGERLQLDRYYPPRVAFEFNGPQHYRPTDKYSVEDVAQQRARDYIKLGICVSRRIELRVVHPEDLTLAKMKELVGSLLPLRDLTHEGAVIRYLESVSRAYRRAARRGSFKELHQEPKGPQDQGSQGASSDSLHSTP